MPRRFHLGIAAVALVLVAGMAAVVLLDRVDVVVTSGVSMNPEYDEGDAVVIAAQDSYTVGEIVAYRDRVHDLVVLHRIVGGDAAGYELKGDNNQVIDAVHPAQRDLIGRAVLHVPQAGTWLRRLTNPVPLAIVAFLLLAGGGSAVRLRRRQRRRGKMPRHLARSARPTTSLRTLPPHLQTAAGVTAVIGVLGLALVALAWTGPVLTLERSTQQEIRSMTFSYAASVPRTPAYDDTTVTSPDTVFRRLVNTVDVRFTYQGNPGSMTVDAELSTASGWRSTVPLAAPATFTSPSYAKTVRLDLTALDSRAKAAAAVTGLPADHLNITITPRVTTADGATFAPALRLALVPMQLRLVDDPNSLTVKDSTTVQQAKSVPRTLAILGRHVEVGTARIVSAVMVLVALLGAAALLLVARRSAPADESAAIRRRHAPLLVPVHPMPMPAGRPVVDVTEFMTLVKLAERYGLLILHWSRSDVVTFIVQDEGTTYRYRTGASVRTTPKTVIGAAI